MQFSLNWQFSTQEVQTSNWRNSASGILSGFCLERSGEASCLVDVWAEKINRIEELEEHMFSTSVAELLVRVCTCRRVLAQAG